MGCCFGPCGPSVDRLSAGSEQVWGHFWVVRDMPARELIEAVLGGGGETEDAEEELKANDKLQRTRRETARRKLNG